MKNQKFARVEKGYQKQGIQWIRLIPYEKENSGVGMLLYHDLSKPCLFDDWCLNMDLAMDRAKRFYGVKDDRWMSSEEINEMGIEIIDES